MAFGNPDFDVFQLPEEHEALREAIRALAEKEIAPYAKDGKSWIIEGHGVDPDIVVDNDPAREFRGEDQQLDKAIEVILQELKTKGKTLPPPPAWPDKS